MEKLYELLNQLKDDSRIKFFVDNIDYFDNVCNYLLSQFDTKDYEFKKLSYMDSAESFRIANDILMQLSSKYPELMESYIKEQKIEITDRRNNQHGDGIVKFRNGELKIQYGLHYDINDVFLIVHEFMHSLNKRENDSDSKKLFSEACSVYSEYLTFDYLEKNGINVEENSEMLKLRMFYFQKRISDLKEYIEAIKYIKQNNIRNVSNAQPDITDKMKLLNSVDYSLASIFSIILFNRNINGLFNNEEYTYLVERIKDASAEESINKVFPNGLDINEFVSGYENIKLFINKESMKQKI